MAKKEEIQVIEGYRKFCEFIENVKVEADKPLYIYFTGSKGKDGKSWCEDCRNAWPVVEDKLKQAHSKIRFVVVEVGDRETWKDPKCPFRTDPKTKLMKIPTLIKWKCPQRLEQEQLSRGSLVSMIFEEDLEF